MLGCSKCHQDSPVPFLSPGLGLLPGKWTRSSAQGEHGQYTAEWDSVPHVFIRKGAGRRRGITPYITVMEIYS